MNSKRHYLFYIIISFINCNIHKNIQSSIQLPKAIFIVDCHQPNFLKKGDTLLLNGIKKGDTLNISFGSITSNGLEWDYIKDSISSQKAELLNQSSIPEAKGQMTRYQFAFLIKNDSFFDLNFSYKREEGTKSYGKCVIQNGN